MFLLFSLILTLYITLSYIYKLPFSKKQKAFFIFLLLVASGRYFILRHLYGGMGFVEAPVWLIMLSSFFQGIVVFLFFLCFIKDLLKCFLKVILLISARLPKPLKRSIWKKPGPVKTSALMLIVSIVFSGYSLYQAARVPNIVETEVILDRLPSELDGFRIGLLSDLHLCRFFNQNWAKEVVTKTNTLSPDIILITGDLVDGTVEARRADIAPLKELSSTLGTFAITGNHEYYSGLSEWAPAFEALNIKMLYNQHIVLSHKGQSLTLAGVTDPAALSSRYQLPGPDLKAALEGAPKGIPVILMDHRPGRSLENAKDQRVDLQLSGHVHGGMMPIVNLLLKYLNDGFLSGWYDINKLKLYTHPGTGLWPGFPVRFLDPSEITLLTLRSTQTSEIKP